MYCDLKMNSGKWNSFELCAASSGSDVNATFKEWSPSHIGASNSNWTMRLYRWVNGEWKLGGTRTGYVSKVSPSNRTFTNVNSGKIMVEVEMEKPEFFRLISVIIPSH